VRRSEEATYREFVAARLDGWRRTAYLVCRDWHVADDLVGTVIEKLYRRWTKLGHVGNLDGYVRGMLVRAWLDELRRPWRREVSVADVRDVPRVGVPQSAVLDRMVLSDLLDSLPAGKRAILVLRFYCDLSIEDTAAVLGIAPGTVKSQTTRGLEAMRILLTEGPTR
jgi:RNA polymerase sigma-70 factor (sigma-E family)